MSFHIVLHEPEIPFNTGNIGRLCLANHTTLHLIKPLGFSLDDRYLKRGGLDYWEHVDLHIHNNWEDFYQNYYLQNFPQSNIYFLTTKTDNIYTKGQYKENDFFVFGAETRGLPEHIRNNHAGSLITIPMPNKSAVRSLNLSSSVAIVLYEAIRQISV